MMDCEGGEVTIDNIEVLELLEEELSYPPRFRLEFKANKSINSTISQSVIVKFNGVTPPATSTITLEKSGISSLFYIFIFVIILLSNSQIPVVFPCPHLSLYHLNQKQMQSLKVCINIIYIILII